MQKTIGKGGNHAENDRSFAGNILIFLDRRNISAQKEKEGYAVARGFIRMIFKRKWIFCGIFSAWPAAS